jgi:hypothetical protein
MTFHPMRADPGGLPKNCFPNAPDPSILVRITDMPDE